MKAPEHIKDIWDEIHKQEQKERQLENIKEDSEVADDFLYQIVEPNRRHLRSLGVLM